MFYRMVMILLMLRSTWKHRCDCTAVRDEFAFPAWYGLCLSKEIGIAISEHDGSAAYKSGP